MGCTIHTSKTAESRVLQETILTMNERKGEKKGDASPNWPGPGQAMKEENKREEPWFSSFQQGALNELHHTLQPRYKKSSLMFTFSCKFTSHIN
jgi:hypothetical protein